MPGFLEGERRRLIGGVAGATISALVILGWQRMYERSLNPTLIAFTTNQKDSYVLQGACNVYTVTSPDSNFTGTLQQKIDDERRTLVAHTSISGSNINIEHVNMGWSRFFERIGFFKYRASFDTTEVSGFLFCPSRIY